MNTQPKSRVYEKNAECTLPRDFIRRVCRPHTTYCCWGMWSVTHTYAKLLTPAKILTRLTPKEFDKNQIHKRIS